MTNNAALACPQKDQFLVYAADNGGAVLVIVLLGSVVALAYNVTHNLLLKRTSSVAVRPSCLAPISCGTSLC